MTAILTDDEKRKRVAVWVKRIQTDLSFAAPELHAEKIATAVGAAMHEAHGWGVEDERARHAMERR